MSSAVHPTPRRWRQRGHPHRFLANDCARCLLIFPPIWSCRRGLSPISQEMPYTEAHTNCHWNLFLPNYFFVKICSKLTHVFLAVNFFYQFRAIFLPRYLARWRDCHRKMKKRRLIERRFSHVEKPFEPFEGVSLGGRLGGSTVILADA